MQIRVEKQNNPVADEVSALVAVTRPIIAGIYHSIGQDMLSAIGKREDIKLKLLGKIRSQGDGDTGIAFEYAVHDAVVNGVPIVVERVADALGHCRINRGDPSSILFAIEKSGSQQLISTKIDLVTTESRVLSGERGQPVKLKGHLNRLAAAFRRPSTRAQLPQSIRGLWKADLFLGSTEPDHWVGTTVKINRSHLEAARGLRVAIVPSKSGSSDAIKKDEQRNLIVCPMPHDGSFMQVFYEGWRIVQALCETNFKMPKEVDLPSPIDREVARVYIERREFPVPDVLEATRKFAQPELLVADEAPASHVAFGADAQPETSTIITPFPRMSS
ncbi:hypothetical protein [Streptomyces fuscigenes]|uniref:hypothetical protein n=1 Tax=Streptomyces fuscigenes TaxID=1528880 RepID=UPI001F20D9F3|nr:hypothetical protein [Streptomyces fuscigenes]MCF3960464.1 hypothetical protein [Streptomyces fuscigenes]